MDNSHRPVFQIRVAPGAKQNRWTVLIRPIMALPHTIVLWFLLIAAEILTVLAWFAILFTGRNPFHEYVTNVLRWLTRVNAYTYLLTDEYPPFSLSGDEGYPITTFLEPGSMSRVKVFFRIILAFPVGLVAAFVAFGTAFVGFFAWIITLIRGTLPEPIHNAFAASIRFQTRVSAYGWLVQDPYPRGLFGDQDNNSPVEQAESPSPTTDVAQNAVEVVGEQTAVTASELSVEPARLTPGFSFPPMSPIQVTDSPIATWGLVVTKPGRRVLLVELIVGTIGYIGVVVLYVVLIASGITSLTQGLAWTSSYSSDIVNLNGAAIRTAGVLSSASPNWSVIATECSGVTALVGALATVPQYPVAGPNKHLLEGVGLIDAAAKDCTTTVVPAQESNALPNLTKVFDNGISQLRTFLNQI